MPMLFEERSFKKGDWYHTYPFVTMSIIDEAGFAGGLLISESIKRKKQGQDGK
jgi:hypothetical protein